MQAKATDQHRWLMEMVGSWTYEASCDGAGGEGGSMRGTERVRALGDLWIVAEGDGTAPDGATFTWVMVLGYDPVKGKYVGSWAGSPMSSMFIYEGERDGGRLPLDTTGPRMDDPTKSAQYQDEIEVVSPNERFLRSRMLGDDGAWVQFMEARYTRVG
ncbi:MAG: DUF1579 domain-containing protein [Phycisphaerales bacterium]